MARHLESARSVRDDSEPVLEDFSCSDGLCRLGALVGLWGLGARNAPDVAYGFLALHRLLLFRVTGAAFMLGVFLEHSLVKRLDQCETL